jgi:hypothetical protein
VSIDREIGLIEEESCLSETFQRLGAASCLHGALERRARLDPAALAQRGLSSPNVAPYIRRRHGSVIYLRRP